MAVRCCALQLLLNDAAACAGLVCKLCSICAPSSETPLPAAPHAGLRAAWRGARVARDALLCVRMMALASAASDACRAHARPPAPPCSCCFRCASVASAATLAWAHSRHVHTQSVRVKTWAGVWLCAGDAAEPMLHAAVVHGAGRGWVSRGRGSACQRTQGACAHRHVGVLRPSCSAWWRALDTGRVFDDPDGLWRPASNQTRGCAFAVGWTAVCPVTRVLCGGCPLPVRERLLRTGLCAHQETGYPLSCSCLPST
jgi:hypothetical protein